MAESGTNGQYIPAALSDYDSFVETIQFHDLEHFYKVSTDLQRGRNKNRHGEEKGYNV